MFLYECNVVVINARRPGQTRLGRPSTDNAISDSKEMR